MKRILWCIQCGWSRKMDDSVCVKECGNCSNTRLEFMEISVEEWDVLEDVFKKEFEEDRPCGLSNSKNPFADMSEDEVRMRLMLFYAALCSIAYDNDLECGCGTPPYDDGLPCPKCTAHMMVQPYSPKERK